MVEKVCIAIITFPFKVIQAHFDLLGKMVWSKSSIRNEISNGDGSNSGDRCPVHVSDEVR